jgi:hypothetical protein
MDFTPARKYPYKKGRIFLGHSPIRRREVGIRTDRHMLTIAGARSGKGAALIIPNLLRWPHNALVIDPKGEAAIATATDRKRKMGQKVHVLDPFGVSGLKTACFNPLAAIDPNDPNAREDIKVLADGLVLRHDPSSAHWDDGALDVIAGVMAYVLHTEEPENRTLNKVREIIADKDIGKVADAMDGNSALGNLMTGAAGRLLRTGNEATHFRSGAIANTAWLDSGAMQDMLSRSTFDLADLKAKNCTVFLVLPSHLLSEHGRFLRLFVRAALNAMAKGGTRGGKKCLFILDEFYSLGKLDEIAKAAGLMPGYGVHLWPFLQDLGQLEELYGRDGASTFFGNADAHIFFGNTDAPTLDYVSKQIGIRYEAGAFDADKEMVGKPHMSPREIRAHVAKKDSDAVARRMIVFAKGSDVLSLRLAPYFKGRRKMFRLFLEVAWYTFLIAVCMLIYAKVGPDDLASYWQWQWQPYTEFGEKYFSDFMRGDGQIFKNMLLAVVVLMLLVLAFRVSVFFAKIVLAFAIAQTLLAWYTTLNIPEPQPVLLIVAPMAAVWVVVSAMMQNVGMSQRVRNIFRRLKS